MKILLGTSKMRYHVFVITDFIISPKSTKTIYRQILEIKTNTICLHALQLDVHMQVT